MMLYGPPDPTECPECGREWPDETAAAACCHVTDDDCRSRGCQLCVIKDEIDAAKLEGNAE